MKYVHDKIRNFYSKSDFIGLLVLRYHVQSARRGQSYQHIKTCGNYMYLLR